MIITVSLLWYDMCSNNLVLVAHLTSHAPCAPGSKCTMYCSCLHMKSGVFCPRGSHCKSCLPTSKLGCVQHTDPILSILGESFYFNIKIKSQTRGSANIGKPYTVGKLFSQGIWWDLFEFSYVAWRCAINVKCIKMHFLGL